MSRRSGEPVAYQVRGLPEGLTIMVAKFGQWWQIIVQTSETSGEWLGSRVTGGRVRNRSARMLRADDDWAPWSIETRR
jgi:hypothetical protein